jgi:hypothetical protein
MNDGQKVYDSVWDSGTPAPTNPVLEIRNNHELPDDAVLFSVAGNGWMVVGNPPLRALLTYLLKRLIGR